MPEVVLYGVEDPAAVVKRCRVLDIVEDQVRPGKGGLIIADCGAGNFRTLDRVFRILKWLKEEELNSKT
jgi:hypothetical protein